MNVEKYFVVYEKNEIMGNKQNLSLEKVQFKGYQPNRFDTEDEAIQALVNDERVYVDFLIIREVFIRS